MTSKRMFILFIDYYKKNIPKIAEERRYEVPTAKLLKTL